MRRALIPIALVSILAVGCNRASETHGHEHDSKPKGHAHDDAKKLAHEKPTKAAHEEPTKAAHSDDKKHAHSDDKKHAHDKAPEAARGPDLKLNNGKKWQTDAHTRLVMQEMDAALTSATPKSVAEYKALGATLKTQVQKLVKGCTMDGPSHDQLHVFLTSFMPAVAALSEARDAARDQATLDELKRLMIAFNSHFA